MIRHPVEEFGNGLGRAHWHPETKAETAELLKTFPAAKGTVAIDYEYKDGDLVVTPRPVMGEKADPPAGIQGPALKDLETMRLANLQTKAAELRIPYQPNDTKAVLIDRIMRGTVINAELDALTPAQLRAKAVALNVPLGAENEEPAAIILRVHKALQGQ